MKKLNIAAIRQLSEENNAPFIPLLVTGFIQHYLGGLETVLLFLMVLITCLFGIDLVYAFIGYGFGLPGYESVFALFNHVFRLIVSFAASFAVLYIEYLYCSKGASFLTTVTGLSRMLCPDKNADHRREELQKTMDQVKS